MVRKSVLRVDMCNYRIVEVNKKKNLFL